jgi:hypothetical protein
MKENKVTILKELLRHVESGKTEAIFMEIQERDTHLIIAANSMSGAVVIVHRDGRMFLAEKERFMREASHA